MADIDILPKRGIPTAALVDSLGIASNGSATLAQLARRGMQGVCAVDSTGNALSGGTLAQLAARGIATFCSVDELGIALDATTADSLRKRGIQPMVLVDANGIAQNGSANMETLRKRGLGYFCPLDENGAATTLGAVVLLSNSAVFDTATIGSTVGVLSVVGGTGTYTYSFLSNPGTLFAISGSNLNTAATMTIGNKPIQIRASGGVPTPVDRVFNITVSQAPTLPINTIAPQIAGTPQENQTLTVTDNGTWTGFPAPSFTYQWKRAPDISYATFDGTAANATLSNGNLTVTHTNGIYGGGRSNALKNAGKFYFEVTATANIAASNQFVAVLAAATTYGSASASGAGGGIVLQGASGLIFANNASTGLTIGTITNGDIIGVACDLDNEKIWFRKAPSGNWNGQAIGSQNPATNTGGGSLSSYSATTMAPAVGFDQGSSTGTWTANFGASTFSGAVPSGFTSGWIA